MKHESYQKKREVDLQIKAQDRTAHESWLWHQSQIKLEEIFWHNPMPEAWQGEHQEPATDYTDGSRVPRDTEPQRQTKKVAFTTSPRVWHAFNSYTKGKLVSLHSLRNNCIPIKHLSHFSQQACPH